MKKATVSVALLTILSLAVSLAAAAPPVQETDSQVYVVQKDDWLSKIAEKYYANMFAYPVIVEATNAKAADDASFAVIENPDLIEIGQKLWIPAALPTSSAGSRLTLAALRNATYQGIYPKPVQLVDGKYEGEPFVAGGASRPTVTLVDGLNAFGDLDGDGLSDTAVVLAENSGGSGVFLYLAAVLDENGQPANAATQLLGDRVDVRSLAIQEGEIALNGLTSGPNDPLCCPSLRVSLRFRLENGRLLDQTEFAGTYQASLPAASTPGRNMTLTLNADGSAERSTDYLNGEAPIVETGTWQPNGDGTATVSLTGRPGGVVYEAPDVMIFRLIDDQLVAVVYDIQLYGSEGLQLTRQ